MKVDLRVIFDLYWELESIRTNLDADVYEDGELLLMIDKNLTNLHSYLEREYGVDSIGGDRLIMKNGSEVVFDI